MGNQEGGREGGIPQPEDNDHIDRGDLLWSMLVHRSKHIENNNNLGGRRKEGRESWSNREREGDKDEDRGDGLGEEGREGKRE